MDKADDETVWRYAGDKGYAIVTRDADFNERSVIHGYPPKIVWLRCGNVSTEHILGVLRRHHADLLAFDSDPESGCLQLY